MSVGVNSLAQWTEWRNIACVWCEPLQGSVTPLCTACMPDVRRHSVLKVKLEDIEGNSTGGLNLCQDHALDVREVCREKQKPFIEIKAGS